MTTTVVTALYDIGREHLSGKYAHRPFQKYLDWFKNLLLLNVPMVIFIPPELEQHINRSYPTKVVSRTFQQLQAYQYHDKIQSVIDHMRANNYRKYFDDCPEFMTAKYETIIFSKFDFLAEVANSNPFNTEYFIWLDAGTFRQIPNFDYTLSWPDSYKIDIIKDKFLLPNRQYNPNIINDNYMFLNDNGLYAYILGGNKTSVNSVRKKFWQQVDKYLNLNVINNEQHILAIMLKEQPKDFYLWKATGSKYPSLSNKDIMIPYELSVGKLMSENYPINNQIKLLTVASENISPGQYQKWEQSARYYGYNYEILGRNDKWISFNTKIKLCYQRLQSIKEQYTVITDCTDLFMCAPSQELYEKLKNVNLVVGGEWGMFYRKGKYPDNIIKKYFEDIKKSEHAFPNGGFVCGRTDQVLKLMEHIIDYEDDQGGYYDIIYEKKLDFNIDYETKFVGNILDYGNINTKYQFYFNEKQRRYINKKSGEAPIALHFPGKHWNAMKEFWNVSQTESDTNEDSWLSLIFFVLVIIVFIIIIYLIHRLSNL